MVPTDQKCRRGGGSPLHPRAYTFGTKLEMKGIDTMLARELTRHKSESSFTRYSKRALELKVHQQFYQVFGEENPQSDR